MHHVVLEQWSRQDGLLHRRDARAKVIALVAVLVAVATTQGTPLIPGTAYVLLLVLAAAASRLPVAGLVRRAAVVIPFTGTFALISWWMGETERAAALLVKSYLSTLAVLIVVGSTPMPQLIRSLEWMRAPRFFLMVVQFLYRYLFVISEQAQHMRQASLCRGAAHRAGWRHRFRAMAGALAVLFARSYARAEIVHRAMLARGFDGRFRLLTGLRFGWVDAAFLTVTLLCVTAIRLGGAAALAGALGAVRTP